MTFKDLGISQPILQALKDLNFEQPTPIQQQAIPALCGKKSDFFGLAQTGTGKTAAFGIPLIEHMDLSNRVSQAIVLCPTRELCVQISNDLKKYAYYIKDLRIAAVYGGAGIMPQIAQLRSGSHIVVGTPGRVIDLIKRGALDLSTIRIAILDEADEMLNMGFKQDIETILKQTPSTKNVWLFSATMPNDIEAIANRYMNNPVRVTVGQRNSSTSNIAHHYCVVKRGDQYKALVRFVDYSPDMFGILFCRTKRDTQEIASKLISDGYHADALHGDLSQAQRDFVMNKFRKKKLKLLVATDVAARGIDVSDVTHVLHFGLPEDIENYTHRSGRTARAGKSGISLSLITSRDLSKIRSIERQIKQPITIMRAPDGTDIMLRQAQHWAELVEQSPQSDLVAPYVAKALETINGLSKEDLLARLLSLHFGNKLSSYQKTEDLNSNETSSPQRQRSFNDHKDAMRFATRRLHLSAGERDGVTKGNLIHLIRSHTRLEGRPIGRIDVFPNETFFVIDNNQAEKVIKAMSGKMINNQVVQVQPATR